MSLDRRMNPWRFVRGVMVCALLGWLAGEVSAQGNAEARLKVLEERFGTELRKASRDTLENYTKSLARLKEEAIQEGDYDQAGKAAAELKYWTEFLQGDGDDLKNRPADVVVEFDLGQAGKGGGVIFRDRLLIRWTNTQSDAVWDLSRLVPGSYMVEVVYSCNEKLVKEKLDDGKEIETRAGGSFEFSEVTNLIGLRDRALPHEVIPTSTWEDFRTERIGRLTVHGTSGRFRLRTTEVHPQGLMKLKALRFLKEKKRDTDRDEKREVDANRQLANRLKAFGKQKELAATARVAAYVKVLKEFIAEARKGDDEAFVEVLERELEMVLEGKLP